MQKAQSTHGKAFKVVKFGARSTVILSAAISTAEGADALNRGDNNAAAKAGLDLTMLGVGVYGGPPGIAVAGTYFAIDMTVGFEAGSRKDILPGNYCCIR